MDLITMKQKLLGELKNSFGWRFSELQEESRCTAVTAHRNREQYQGICFGA